MTSFETVDAIKRFLAAVNSQTYLVKVLRSLTESHDTVLSALVSTVTLQHNAAASQNERARTVAFETLVSCRTVKPFELSRELDELERAISQLAATLPQGPREHLQGYKRVIESLRNAYTEFVQGQELEHTIRLLAAAKPLQAAIDSDRGILSIIAENLENSASSEPPPEGLARLAILLQSEHSFRVVVEKLEALLNLYDELCELLAVASHEYPPILRKIETGSLWIDILGYPKVIALIEKYIDAALNFMHRKFTNEGKLEAIPRQQEHIDAVLQFSQSLAEEGFDISGIKDNLQKAAVKVAQDLNKIVGGEPVVTINGRTHSVSVAIQQKMIAQRGVLHLENQETDKGTSLNTNE